MNFVERLEKLMENDQLSHQLPQSTVMITDNDGQPIEESPPSLLYTSATQAGTESSDSANSTFDSTIIDRMQLLITEIQRLKEDFETKAKYDESKDRLIDSLHRELQLYREGLHFKILRPVFIDLIAMHDDLGKLIESTMTKEASNTLDRTIKNLQSF
jgi:molecular chaperone GrpE